MSRMTLSERTMIEVGIYARQSLTEIGKKIDTYLPSVCVLDFKAVTFMDSSGIAIVINTLRRMRELEGAMRLSNVPAQPMKVLKAAGIERITAIEFKGVTV